MNLFLLLGLTRKWLQDYGNRWNRAATPRRQHTADFRSQAEADEPGQSELVRFVPI